MIKTVMADAQLDRRGVLITCPTCGQRNRLPFTALGGQTRCGKCATGLTAPNSPIEVQDAAAFDAAVATSTLPIIVDFWAPWCGPCRVVAPELARVSAQTAGRYLVVKVNTDAVPELGERFRIRSIPTMAVFNGGREVSRSSGARPAAEILSFVESAVASR